MEAGRGKNRLFLLHQTSETTEFRLGESAYPYMYAITGEFTVGEEVCMNYNSIGKEEETHKKSGSRCSEKSGEGSLGVKGGKWRGEGDAH